MASGPLLEASLAPSGPGDGTGKIAPGTLKDSVTCEPLIALSNAP